MDKERDPKMTNTKQAIEAFEFCIETIANKHIKDDESCIWSSGSHSRPTITATDLKNALTALKTQEKLENGCVLVKGKPAAYWARYDDGSGKIYEEKERAENYAEQAYVNIKVIPVAMLAAQENDDE